MAGLRHRLRLWDDDAGTCCPAATSSSRATPARSRELPLALTLAAACCMFSGELAAAGVAGRGGRQPSSEATGSNIAAVRRARPSPRWRGRETEAQALIEATSTRGDRTRRRNRRSPSAEWASALLDNGLGRYHEALAAAPRRRSEYPTELVGAELGPRPS